MISYQKLKEILELEIFQVVLSNRQNPTTNNASNTLADEGSIKAAIHLTLDMLQAEE